jgi:hypothetical protein
VFATRLRTTRLIDDLSLRTRMSKFCRSRKDPLFREANESVLGSLFQPSGHIQDGQLAVLVIDIFLSVTTEARSAQANNSGSV